MKLESITVENYRQFEKAELTFDEGITILAGANNSGKTSLINLIKNIFVDDKLNYNMSDIPAKNMREWVEWVYPIFQKFFRDRKTEENVEKDLLNVVIPKEETDSTHLMKMTTVKIHVSYNILSTSHHLICRNCPIAADTHYPRNSIFRAKYLHSSFRQSPFFSCLTD